MQNYRGEKMSDMFYSQNVLFPLNSKRSRKRESPRQLRVGKLLCKSSWFFRVSDTLLSILRLCFSFVWSSRSTLISWMFSGGDKHNHAKNSGKPYCLHWEGSENILFFVQWPLVSSLYKRLEWIVSEQSIYYYTFLYIL